MADQPEAAAIVAWSPGSSDPCDHMPDEYRSLAADWMSDQPESP